MIDTLKLEEYEVRQILRIGLKNVEECLITLKEKKRIVVIKQQKERGKKCLPQLVPKKLASPGIEPGTLALLAPCSNQLSYEAVVKKEAVKHRHSLLTSRTFGSFQGN